jgi:hypothetical protein
VPEAGDAVADEVAADHAVGEPLDLPDAVAAAAAVLL